MQHQPRSGCGLPRNHGATALRLIIYGAVTQRSRAARQRWAGGRNRFAVRPPPRTAWCFESVSARIHAGYSTAEPFSPGRIFPAEQPGRLTAVPAIVVPALSIDFHNVISDDRVATNEERTVRPDLIETCPKWSGVGVFNKHTLVALRT